MQSAPTRPTILIVDDNQANLRIATAYLQMNQFEILTARDGQAGIERALLAQPDLILLDVHMPGIDGFEVCRTLKANPQTTAIPVIFMTAQTNIEAIIQGFEVGGVDYIAKPFHLEELLARVTTHLTIFRLQRELQAEILERKQTEAALRKANLELQRLAVLDELTQIANRRRFDQYLEAQWSQAQQPGLSLLLCDIDSFKSYNDGYGHQAGDHCLHLIAQGLSRAVGRVKDLVARYGGEEFAAILPNTDLTGALAVAQAMRDQVRALNIPHAFSAVNRLVTVSIGVSSIIPSRQQSPSELIAAADAALYAAKNAGRDRIATAEC
jgi:diguanylate cyclase (GGDEF)-like protein